MKGGGCVNERDESSATGSADPFKLGGEFCIEKLGIIRMKHTYVLTKEK